MDEWVKSAPPWMNGYESSAMDEWVKSAPPWMNGLRVLLHG